MEKKVLGSNHGRLSERVVLLREAPWIPRNQTCPSDVTKLQHQHDNTLQTNASSTVGRTSPLETIKVVCHGLGVDLGLLHLLFKEDGVVDTLATGKNLLTADEDIVGVGQLGVLRIRHGVERASTSREFVYWKRIRKAVAESDKSHLPRM